MDNLTELSQTKKLSQTTTSATNLENLLEVSQLPKTPESIAMRAARAIKPLPKVIDGKTNSADNGCNLTQSSILRIDRALKDTLVRLAIPLIGDDWLERLKQPHLPTEARFGLDQFRNEVAAVLCDLRSEDTMDSATFTELKDLSNWAVKIRGDLISFYQSLCDKSS